MIGKIRRWPSLELTLLPGVGGKRHGLCSRGVISSLIRELGFFFFIFFFLNPNLNLLRKCSFSLQSADHHLNSFGSNGFILMVLRELKIMVNVTNETHPRDKT